MTVELLIFILELVKTLLSVLTTGICLYQISIAIFTLKRPLSYKPLIDKKHRFAIVIAARNEQDVIGYLIDSLHAQNYPRELFDVYVIADNCTDDTASVARNHGATAYERFNSTLVGKGHALHWMFDIMMKETPDQYDAVCIFDADNLVDGDYLLEMNRQLCAGTTIAQGYRDVKNPTDNWVSGGYTIYWMTLTRLYHIPRNNIGFSAMVSGTGFMFRTDILVENGGWHTHSLCEDSEFSLLSIAQGHKIVLARKAIFYDEQPTSFPQSLRQRYRWAVGNLQCIKYCLPSLVKSLFTKGNALAVDAILYLLSIPCIFLAALNALIQLFIYSTNIQIFFASIPSALLAIIVSYLVLMAQGLLVLILEKRPIRPMGVALLTYPISVVSWMAISFISLFYQNVSWKPIAHTKKISIEQLKR